MHVIPNIIFIWLSRNSEANDLKFQENLKIMCLNVSTHWWSRMNAIIDVVTIYLDV